MQFNPAFSGPGFPNYGQFYPTNPPFQSNGPSYPDVIGEGEVTSLMLPDGSIQFYFMPTSPRWCSPFMYPPNIQNGNYPYRNNINNPEVWFVRSISNPLWSFLFNQQSQQQNQIHPAPGPSLHPGLQFKTESKNKCRCGQKSCKVDTSQSSMSIEDTKSERKSWKKDKKKKGHFKTCHSSSTESSESSSSKYKNTKPSKKKKKHYCNCCSACSLERKENKKDGASPSSHSKKDKKHKNENKTNVKKKNRASQSSITSKTSTCSCSSCKSIKDKSKHKKDKNGKEVKKDQVIKYNLTSENTGCNMSKQIKFCGITINEPESMESAEKPDYSLSFGDSKQKITPLEAAKPIFPTLYNDPPKIEESGIKCAHINEICGCPFPPDTSNTYGIKCAHIEAFCECPDNDIPNKMITDPNEIISHGGNESQIYYQSIPVTRISNPFTESKMDTWFSKTQLLNKL